MDSGGNMGGYDHFRKRQDPVGGDIRAIRQRRGMHRDEQAFLPIRRVRGATDTKPAFGAMRKRSDSHIRKQKLTKGDFRIWD